VLAPSPVPSAPVVEEKSAPAPVVHKESPAKRKAETREEEMTDASPVKPSPKKQAVAESNADKLSDAEIEGMKVVDLKAELKKRGLAQSGKKDELIERLKAAM